jgi:hypothetical protein
MIPSQGSSNNSSFKNIKNTQNPSILSTNSKTNYPSKNRLSGISLNND